MKIYLLGMPGSGKTTLGKSLAISRKELFIDLDKEIETNADKSISEIFSEDGESEFRKLESDLLRRITLSNRSFIMSTGGGAPCHHDNISYMVSSGITIYLKVSLHELNIRLKTDKDSRPLLSKPGELNNTIKELLLAREKYYSKASIIIESDSISLKDIESALAKN